ncbi:MAG: hypothetical protein OZ921_07050 [Sorangiineae bacterium]|nr:hypothetical protein [Polyangiaceae bacterium]MEB2322253.1 hypothetical protein [Sorangiineae bacterium]
MTRTLVGLISSVLLASACGSTPQVVTAPAVARAHAAPAKSDERTSIDAKWADDAAPAARPRIGDYVVQRITGSFSKTPLMLTEQVIGVDGDVVTLDYTLVEGRSATRLRVERLWSTGHISKVTRYRDGKPAVGDVNDFDAMMRKTAFAADDNQGQLESGAETCLVGRRELACEKTSYKVKVGDRSATLSVSRSNQLAERDVSGEIRTDDGEVVYRAQVIEFGNEGSGSNVARLEQKDDGAPLDRD